MQMDTKMIVEALENDQKDKDEVSGLIDQFIESLSQEIEMLGANKRDRLDRHAAMGQRIAEECDAKADLLIRRKDIVMNIKAKLNGQHPEQILLVAEEVEVMDYNEKPRKVKFLNFGKKAGRAA